MVVFDPFICIRIITVAVAVGVLVSVVAASITIVIILKSDAPLMVVRADIRVVLDRLIAASYELERYYDKPATLEDLIQSLNEYFQEVFAESFIRLIILEFSEKPDVIESSTQKRRKREIYRPSIVSVAGHAYFRHNHTKEQIINALKNYSRMITLLTQDRKPSSRLATFSVNRSRSTDTYPHNWTETQVEKLKSITVNPDPPDDSQPPKTNTTSPVPIVNLNGSQIPIANATPPVPIVNLNGSQIPIANATPPATTVNPNDTHISITNATPSITIVDPNGLQTPIANATPHITTVDPNGSQNPITTSTIAIISRTTTTSTTETITITESASATLTTTQTTSTNGTTSYNTNSYTDTPAFGTDSTCGNASSECTPIIRVNITVALERLMTNNESAQFYNRSDTRLYLFNSVYAQMAQYFPYDFITFTMLNISDEPLVVSSNSSIRRKRAEDGMDTSTPGNSRVSEVQLARKSMMFVNGFLYFSKYISNEQIVDAFQKFTPVINLNTSTGQPSSSLSSLVNEQSSFGSISCIEISNEGKNFFMCFNSNCNDATNTSDSTDGKTSSTLAAPTHTNQTVFKADIRVHLNFNFTALDVRNYYNDTSLENLVYSNFLLYFPNTLVDFVVSTVLYNSSSSDRLSSVIINGSVYFALNYNSEEIANAFKDFQVSVSSVVNPGKAIAITANISMKDSIFPDTYLAQIPYEENHILDCIYII